MKAIYARACSLMIGCLLLAGCATQPWVQEPDKVRVRLGRDVKLVQVSDVVAPMLPYMLLADLAYVDPKQMLKPGTKEPDYERHFAGYGDASSIAIRWMQEWEYLGGYEVADHDTDHRLPWLKNGKALSGLGLHIWRRRGEPCREVVIAYRGTDGPSLPDWVTNLRWFTRIFGYYDQYDQMADALPELVKHHKEFQDCSDKTATGHSLGGGLAQQAGYLDARFRRIYAFDPSFVTGYYDIKKEVRERNKQGLHVERIYEHGEVLAYPRVLLRYLYPPETKDPQIRELRYNVLVGTVIKQHKLHLLAEYLLKVADAAGIKPPDHPIDNFPSPRQSEAGAPPLPPSPVPTTR